MAEARRADAAPRPGQDARAVLHPAAHRPDRAAQQRHLAAVGAAARDPGADHARQPALVDDPLPDHHHPVPDADRAAQQEAAHGAARPDPQRRPRGDRAAPAARAVQGRDRHRRGRHPDHPRLALGAAGRRAARGAARPPGRRHDPGRGPPGDRAAGGRAERPSPSRCSPASTGRGCGSRRSACRGWPWSPGRSACSPSSATTCRSSTATTSSTRGSGWPTSRSPWSSWSRWSSAW